MPTLSHVQRLQMQQGGRVAVSLVQAEDVHGKPFYAYLKMTAQQVQDLDRAIQGKQSIDLREFGEVLEYDFGEEPPEGVRQMIVEKYGLE